MFHDSFESIRIHQMLEHVDWALFMLRKWAQHGLLETLDNQERRFSESFLIPGKSEIRFYFLLHVNYPVSNSKAVDILNNLKFVSIIYQLFTSNVHYYFKV